MNIALAIVFRKSDNRFLFLKRKNSCDGLGWVFPGGKLNSIDEYITTCNEHPKFIWNDCEKSNEVVLKAATRELFEETGVKCQMRHGKIIDKRVHPKTDVQAYYILFSQYICAAKVKEADKFEMVQWFSKDEIDANIGLENFTQSVQFYIQNMGAKRPSCNNGQSAVFKKFQAELRLFSTQQKA